MDLGSVLLVFGIASSVAAALSALPALSKLIPNGRGVQRALAGISFLSVSGALALLIWASVTSDFSYRYVWEHTSTDLEPVYKLSAVWAGSGGSLLLCTWLVSVVLVTETFALGHARDTGKPFRSVFVSAMSLLIAFFAAMALLSGVFDRIDFTMNTAYPDGLGLDSLLQTPEMVAHAPLVFGAYAALCALFAASAAHHITGDLHWSKVGLTWGRLGWLLLTAGIGLGAVWAYYVVGWGGYWSWDPVETASLVPWFMVTAFLHTQQRYSCKGEYRVASPLFGMLSMVGVVFVSFVVRAGGLWTSSVHDYGAAPDSSGVSRLISLLQEETSLVGTLEFMLLLLAVASYLSVRAMRGAAPPPSPGRPKRLSGYVNDQNNMFLAVILLGLSALVAIALMVKNVESSPGTAFAELDQKMSVLFVAVMMVMGLCVGWRLVGRELAFPIAIWLVCASVALALAGAVSGLFDGMVAFVLPSFIFAVTASGVRLAQALTKGPARTRAFRAGAQLAHVGIALVLASYVVSTNLQSYPAEGSEVALSVGGQVSVGDYVLSLAGLEVSNDTSGYPAGVDQVRTALVDIYKDGDLLVDDARLEVLYELGPAMHYQVLETVAFVKSSLTEDLCMSFHWMTEETALIHAKVVPMMLPLWGGVVLLMAGLSARMLAFRAPAADAGRKA